MFASRVPPEPLPVSSSTPVQLSATPARNRGFSRTSRTGGSAYGYGGAYRSRLASNGTLGPMSLRRGSTAAMSYRRRRESNANAMVGEPSLSASYATGTELNFAQRLLMANENTVTNIADLWVAAAMNVDNEDPFESEDEFQIEGDDNDIMGDEFDESDLFANGQSPRSDTTIRRPSHGSEFTHAGSTISPYRPAAQASSSRRPSAALPVGLDSPALASPRRLSSTTAPIFSHVGVRTPPAVVEAQQLLALADEAERTEQDTLAPIMEGSRLSQTPIEDQDATPAQEPSLMSQLPLLIIFQYGILALHSTTHDQVFYLYLVS